MADIEFGDIVQDNITGFKGVVTGRTESINICDRITVQPQGRSLLVTDEIKVKPPVAPVEASLFFADKLGNLMRDDPDQMTIPGMLREVPAIEPAAVREIGANQ